MKAPANLERKIFKLGDDIEFTEKADHEEDERPDFKGVASVMNVEDLHGDVIDSGAFTQTLKHKNNRIILLADHMPDRRIGIGMLEEADPKVKLDGFVNIEKQLGADTLSDIKFSKKHGIALGLSIGFETKKQDFIEDVRHIKELALWEVSVVTFPANTRAKITSTKSIVSFQDLPIASGDVQWNAKDANKRVREFSNDGMPNEKYKSAFIWVDHENQKSFDAFKLQIADVVDGKLQVIPRALFAAAAIVQGIKCNVNILDTDLPRMKSHLGRYYKKMDLIPPWESQNVNLSIELANVIGYASQLKETGKELSDTEVNFAKGAIDVLFALLPEGIAVRKDALMQSIYNGIDSEALGKEADQKQIDGMVDFLKNLRTGE